MSSRPLPVGIELPLRFFFYGTLIGGGPPEVRAAVSKLSDLGPARVSGLLWALPDPAGWYPALLAGEGAVNGRLYQARSDFGEAELAALDAYEDCDPAEPGGPLYRRVVLAEGVQAYRFNRALPAGARLIERGDFAAWIQEHGLRPFEGWNHLPSRAAVTKGRGFADTESIPAWLTRAARAG